MREIKFRAWVFGEMFEVRKIDFVEEFFTRVGKPGAIGTDVIDLMQYTGLKDKNGVEIYEGDVVKGNDTLFTARYEVAEVYYDKQHTQFRARVDYHTFLLRDYLGDVVEVIGNIYENPDLLP